LGAACGCRSIRRIRVLWVAGAVNRDVGVFIRNREPVTLGSMAGSWGVTPRQSVEAECGQRGRAAVVSGCVDLLCGREADDELILALGGPAAEYVLGGREGGKSGYWPRVWAARGLLYVWDERAAAAVIRAAADPAWRVREMAAKVIARHAVGGALTVVAELQDDPVPRVRNVAQRALRILTARNA
jgi:HEAT repeat protein